MTPAVAKAMARHGESHGKRKIIKIYFVFRPRRKNISVFLREKSVVRKKRNLFDFIGSKSVMMCV